MRSAMRTRCVSASRARSWSKYQLDPGALGARRQHVTIDRIRVDETST
jgi:hypothetical protein